MYDHVIWTVGAGEVAEAFGIEPVKGAAFALQPASDLPDHIIRFGHHYIVPKVDRVIVGATIEPGVRDTRPDVDLLNELRKTAAEVCPGAASAKIIDTWSGLRPKTADHAPLLGRLENGDFIASGHYRNGILLAPVTAKIMADLILDERVTELSAAFDPARFHASVN